MPDHIPGVKAIQDSLDYYPQVDAITDHLSPEAKRAAVDAIMDRFAPNAVYQRWDKTWEGRPAIDNFFMNERTLRGEHHIDAVHPAVYVEGSFDGEDKGHPVHLAFQDVWLRNDENKVVKRRSYLQHLEGSSGEKV